MLYPWLTLMYCVRVEKGWSTLKSMNQLLGWNRGCSWWESFCVMKMKHSLTIWFCRDELSLAMLFWDDMIALLVCLKYYYFHATINKITLSIMLGSIPHKKFCFYHLPTRGRAGIKLGDAWYVSNVSIIFDCSMLYYILFWMINGLYYTLLYYFWD